MNRMYRDKHVVQIDSPIAHIIGAVFGAFMATGLGFIFWMVVNLLTM